MRERSHASYLRYTRGDNDMGQCGKVSDFVGEIIDFVPTTATTGRAEVLSGIIRLALNG